jgi:hypothetical protein
VISLLNMRAKKNKNVRYMALEKHETENVGKKMLKVNT